MRIDDDRIKLIQCGAAAGQVVHVDGASGSICDGAGIDDAQILCLVGRYALLSCARDAARQLVLERGRWRLRGLRTTRQKQASGENECTHGASPLIGTQLWPSSYHESPARRSLAR